MKVGFLGHRTGYDDTGLAEATLDVLKKELKGEPAEFLVGAHGIYDFIARKSCIRYKRLYGNSKTLYVAELDDDHYSKKRKLASGITDGNIYLDIKYVPQNERFAERNKWVVDMSDLIICYLTNTCGETYNAIEYAVKKKKRIINIGSVNIEQHFTNLGIIKP